jgi:putative heme degradation protein
MSTPTSTSAQAPGSRVTPAAPLTPASSVAAGPLRLEPRWQDLLRGVAGLGEIRLVVQGESASLARLVVPSALQLARDRATLLGAGMTFSCDTPAGAVPVLARCRGQGDLYTLGPAGDTGWRVQTTARTELPALWALAASLRAGPGAGGAPEPAPPARSRPAPRVHGQALRAAWDNVASASEADEVARWYGLPLPALLARMGSPRAFRLSSLQLARVVRAAGRALAVSLSLRQGGVALASLAPLRQVQLAGAWLELEGDGLSLRFRARGLDASVWAVRLRGPRGFGHALVACYRREAALVSCAPAAAGEPPAWIEALRAAAEPAGEGAAGRSEA